MAFTHRVQKGSALTNQEVDDNFRELENIYSSSTIFRADVAISGTGQIRNDQSSIIKLANGQLAILFNGYTTGAVDASDSSIKIAKSSDGGRSWQAPTVLISSGGDPKVVPSLWKKTNGDIIVIYIVRLADGNTNIVRRIYNGNLDTIVENDFLIASGGYFPVKPDAINYDERNDRLVFPYPRFVSGTKESGSSVYEGKMLMSADDGITWTDSGVTIPGIITGGFGGALEPGFFSSGTYYNYYYFRNLGGNVGYQLLNFANGTYSLGNSGTLLAASNTQSAFRYIPKLRCFVGAYARFDQRKQVDLAISRDAVTWYNLFQIEHNAYSGISGINEPSIFVDENRIIVTYSDNLVIGNDFSLRSISIPFTALTLSGIV